jgi:hypothetical protein
MKKAMNAFFRYVIKIRIISRKRSRMTSSHSGMNAKLHVTWHMPNIALTSKCILELLGVLLDLFKSLHNVEIMALCNVPIHRSMSCISVNQCSLNFHGISAGFVFLYMSSSKHTAHTTFLALKIVSSVEKSKSYLQPVKSITIPGTGR